MRIYLDCNATTPIDKEVSEITCRYLIDDFGNAGSHTHDYGAVAKQAVQKARDQVASLVDAKQEEIFFTSGATESNNLAILGLVQFAKKNHLNHIITTQIEHRSVLRPFAYLESLGFEVTYLKPSVDGRIDPMELQKSLREDTFLVSIMHVNNEIGVIQPISECAKVLKDHQAFFHTDSAQGFGKDFETLQNKRIDFISISGHKVYAPKGIGALIIRSRGSNVLNPLMYGGGQEQGLRPGTLAVPLIAGLGKAAELAKINYDERKEYCLEIKNAALEAFKSLDYKVNGNLKYMVPHTLNISFSGVNSETAISILKDLVAISSGSACSSQNYAPSHVLKAMGYSDKDAQEVLRFSWCHMTPMPDWQGIVEKIKNLQG